MSIRARLTSGEFYDVDIKLFMVAHRFKRGHRIRIALCESLWPLVWPSPEIATLTFELGSSSITLPVRSAPATEAPFPIPVLPRQPKPFGSLMARPPEEFVASESGRPRHCEARISGVFLRRARHRHHPHEKRQRVMNEIDRRPTEQLRLETGKRRRIQARRLGLSIDGIVRNHLDSEIVRRQGVDQAHEG